MTTEDKGERTYSSGSRLESILDRFHRPFPLRLGLEPVEGFLHHVAYQKELVVARAGAEVLGHGVAHHSQAWCCVVSMAVDEVREGFSLS